MELNFDPNSINNDTFAEKGTISNSAKAFKAKSIWSNGKSPNIGVAIGLITKKVREVQRFTKLRQDGTLETLTIINSDGSTKEFIYDTTGENQIKCITTTLNMRIEHIFNDKHQIVETIQTNLKNKNTKRTLNYYLPNGEINRKIEADGKYTTDFRFDELGRPITIIRENPEGTSCTDCSYRNNELNWYMKTEKKDGETTTYYKEGKKISKTVVQGNGKNITHHLDTDGNYTQTVSSELIKNKYYTGKISYKKIVTNSFIIIKEEKENGKEYSIKLSELLTPFNDNEKKKIIKILHELPGEVILDLLTEVRFSNNKVLKGESGSYSGATDTITLKGGTISSRTIVHELGHAIDYLLIENENINQTNKKFKTIFETELSKFEQAGNKRTIIKHKDTEIQVDNSYDELLGRTYCTANEREMFAECYVLLMLGHSDAEKVITTFFPKTLKCAKEILESTRNLPTSTRKVTFWWDKNK